MALFSKHKKIISSCVLFSQIFAPLFLSFSSIARAYDKHSNEQQIASTASQLGTILSGDNARRDSEYYLKTLGSGLVNERINHWLNQYGIARLAFGPDKMVSGDFLLPFSDETDSLFFTQLGIRTNSDRNIVNVGVGYRQNWKNWLYGVNTFYDYDFRGGNRRLGLGLEAQPLCVDPGIKLYSGALNHPERG